jgi:hypothetical protein
MPTDAVTKLNRNIPAKYKTPFGSPPLHDIEDQKIYDAILCGLAQDIRPQDCIERILLRDLADHVYEIQWLRRLKHRVIRQAHREEMVRRAKAVIAAADVRKITLRNQSEAASAPTKPKVDVPDANKPALDAEMALKAEIEKIDAETRQKLAKLQEAEDGPIDEAALLRNWIAPHDLVDSRLTVTESKFRATLEQFDEHRSGLGQHLRQRAEKIIDIEPAEDLTPAREDELDLAGSSMMADGVAGR